MRRNLIVFFEDPVVFLLSFVIFYKNYKNKVSVNVITKLIVTNFFFEGKDTSIKHLCKRPVNYTYLCFFFILAMTCEKESTLNSISRGNYLLKGYVN